MFLRLYEVTTDNNCPRCGAKRLKGWAELSPDERELVPRLPSTGDYPMEERQKAHLWCTRCWYESAGDVEQTA